MYIASEKNLSEKSRRKTPRPFTSVETEVYSGCCPDSSRNERMSNRKPASSKTLYERFGKGSEEFEKIIGRTAYRVRAGTVSPFDLKLEPVDGAAHIGNPRMWTYHKKLVAAEPGRGPLTEAEQITYLTEFQKDRDNLSVVRDFETLKHGLKASGESQDDLHVLFDGSLVEGNRRTIAMRQLNEEDPEHLAFASPRVICYPPDVSKEDVILSMGKMHITDKSRWGSGDKAELLSFLEESGRTPKQIAVDLGMSVKKVAAILEGGKLLKKYQEEFGDYRPEKFSAFYKVAGNRKLHKMMLLQKDGSIDESYDEDLWVRFCGWVKDDKINDTRGHIQHLTSKEIGLLSHQSMLKVIDTEGTTTAINKVRSMKTSRLYPGIDHLKEAIAELEKVMGTVAEKLAASKEYSTELHTLCQRLDMEVNRLLGRPDEKGMPAIKSSTS